MSLKPRWNCWSSSGMYPGGAAALAWMAALLFSAPAGQAAITYVDATSGVSGNTALAGGGAFTPPLNGNTVFDNNWERRDGGLGNGGDIFETSGEGAAVSPTGENAPRLVTTITGLTPTAQYQLYAFFWSPNDINQSWSLRAGLANLGGDIPSFGRLNNDGVNNATGLVAADNDSFPVIPDTFAPFPALGPADFANPGSLIATTQQQGTPAKTVIVNSARFLWQASLGTAVADGSGQVQIFIDDYVLTGGAPPAGSQTVNNRTWYDGVGFEIVPEPASVALLALAAPLFAGLRRRRRAG